MYFSMHEMYILKPFERKIRVHNNGVDSNGFSAKIEFPD